MVNIILAIRDENDNEVIRARIETTDPMSTLKLWRGWYDRKTADDPKPVMLGSWNGGMTLNNVQGFAADFIHRMVAEAPNNFELLTQEQYDDYMTRDDEGNPVYDFVSVVITRGNGNTLAVPILYVFNNETSGMYEGPLHKFDPDEMEMPTKIDTQDENTMSMLDMLQYLRDQFKDGARGDDDNVAWWAIETAVNVHLRLSPETILRAANTTLDRAVAFATK